MGLAIAQGLVLTESFYWNMNDRTRAFTKRVLPKTPNNYPSMGQAGCYSGTLHFHESDRCHRRRRREERRGRRRPDEEDADQR